MTKDELHQEIESLKTQMEAVQFPSQLEILSSKFNFARAYLLSPEDYPPGLYEVTDQELPMKVDYLNGVMAWGTMNGEEVSFPISLLRKIG
ncbi:DUF1811 family protein [Paenibacillus hexagrammi]|uniref:YfhH family protein n=1 Tax=Paenibacillus hexagrammi TaxID=2908839 RepID=A0ABY3SST9_9BACL|nr:DUF1811 family protein [Paenibacillus sp. YPD9-1]UJF36339.1 YfhH family protein [Paenibacillus sp. YPD9-1]